MGLGKADAAMQHEACGFGAADCAFTKRPGAAEGVVQKAVTGQAVGVEAILEVLDSGSRREIVGLHSSVQGKLPLWETTPLALRSESELRR